MPYTVKTSGMEELSKMLEEMEGRAPAAASMALYEGAGIMADAITSAAKTIRTGPGSSRSEARYATPEEKAAVESAGAGIAKFDKNGTEVQTSIGFRNAGYTTINGRQKAIALIANAINSGTSFMHKQPFVRRAVNSAKNRAAEAMKASIEKQFENL